MLRTLQVCGVLALAHVLAACGGDSGTVTDDAGGRGDGGAAAADVGTRDGAGSADDAAPADGVGTDAGAGDPLVPDQFAASLAELDCGHIRRCWPPDGWADIRRKNACDSHSRVGWQGFAEQVLAPLVAASEFAYHAEAVAQCAAAFAATCYPGLPEDCGRIITGRRGEGEACTLLARFGNWDNWWSRGWTEIMAAFPTSGCGAGLFCDPLQADGTCGQCRPLPGAGEFCGPNRLCAQGTYCAGTRCQPFSGEGEPCEAHVSPSGCRQGLYCFSSTARCVRMPGVGQGCDEDPYSPDFLPCNYESGQPPLDCVAGTCAIAGAAEGEPCAGMGVCRLGLTCGGTCVPFSYVGEGEACDWQVAPCGSNDLVCALDAGSQGVCKPIVVVGIGEPCSGERQCTGLGYCGAGGLCRLAQAEGDTCYHVPPACDPYCAQPGGCSAAEYLVCGGGLYCPADLVLTPGCSDLVCVRYGSNPTCSDDSECGPAMRCAGPGPKCVPLDAQPGFHGPVAACH